METKNKKWLKMAIGLGLGVVSGSVGIVLPIVLNQNESTKDLTWYIQGNENQTGQIIQHKSRTDAEMQLEKIAQKSKVWKIKENSNKEYENFDDAWKDHMSDLVINNNKYNMGEFEANDEIGVNISNLNSSDENMSVFTYNNKTYKDLLHAQNAWLNDNPMKAIGAGDKSGNTYTQAELDKRDGKFAPRDAVEGLNTKGVEKVGLGDGKEYVKRKGFALTPKGKIIEGAQIGYNTPEKIYTNDELIDQILNNYSNRILIQEHFLTQNWTEYKNAINKIKKPVDWSSYINNYEQVTFLEIKKIMYEYDDVMEFVNLILDIFYDYFTNFTRMFELETIDKSVIVGLGDGNTYVFAEGYSLKEDGPTGDYVDGVVEGINSKEIKGVGDQSNKTYTKSQIDARDATITAGNNAILGLNEVDVRNTILDIKSNEIEKKWIKNKDYQNIINGVNWNNSWLHIDTQEMFWLGSDKTKAFTTKEKLKEWYKKTNSDYVTQSDSISKVDIKIGDEIITFKSLAHAKNEIIKNKYV